MAALTTEHQRIIAEVLADAEKLRRYRALDFYEPYLKQREFHALGATKDERALIAANQVGKSHCGAAEDAFHLTGDYPKWWQGHRFKAPPTGWLVGPNQEKVRDTLQSTLFGPWNKPDEFGTGFLPRDAIVGRPTLGRGVSNAFDTATIRWKDPTGRLDDSARSTATFKSYTESLQSFAASTIHFYHGDEESLGEIYGEARVRLQVNRGISYLTLTPLLGWTDLIIRFLKTPAANRAAVKMGIYDACKGHDPLRPHLGHYTRQQADDAIANFEPHLRGARAYGDPALGEGKIFLVPEQQFTIARPDFIPPHWRKIWGIDFGGAGENSHPFAAALLAHDLDFDIVYLLHVLKLRGMSILQHVPKMREIAPNVPVAWPHDGNEKDARTGSGMTLAQQYRTPMPGMLGLNMLDEHATWREGGFSTQAAVDDLDSRMQTGRFKVCADLVEFFDEARQYHREKHQIVKENDDILSAVFKGLMMLRRAQPGYLIQPKVGKYDRKTDEWWKPKGQAADIDPWTGRPVDPPEQPW